MDEQERGKYGGRGYEAHHCSPRGPEKPKRNWVLPALLTALLLVGGVWAWNSRRDTQIQQGASAVRESSAENRAAVPTSRTIQVVKVDANVIQNLRKGEPVNFYLNDFKRKGYTVSSIHRMPDHTTYVVRGQADVDGVRRVSNEGFLVTLQTPNQIDRVTKIETAAYDPIGTCPSLQKAQQ